LPGSGKSFIAKTVKISKIKVIVKNKDINYTIPHRKIVNSVKKKIFYFFLAFSLKPCYVCVVTHIFIYGKNFSK